MTVMSPSQLDRILQRFAALEAEMSQGGGSSYVKLAKDYAELEPVAKAAKTLLKAYAERHDIAELLAAGGDLAEMARSEEALLDERIPALEHEIKLLLLPKDAADDKNVILEVRAGTGGDEAALFA